MTLTDIQEERFFNKVNKTDTCWLWVGGKSAGYGNFSLNKKEIGVHKISYMHHNKTEIPKGLLVCHSCDTPACVNPEHLFLGTHQENMDDMVKKGRSTKGKRDGDKNPHSKLTTEQVLEIASLLDTHTNVELAKEYGVSEKAISDIRIGRTWPSVTGKKRKKNKRSTHNYKITNEQVLEMVTLFDTRTNTQLAKEYGVHRATISNIRTGARWSSVTGIKRKEK